MDNISDFTKLENENYHKYIWRLDGLVQSGKYQNWKEITPMVNKELFGDDEEKYRDESAFRKSAKYARDFYEAGVFDVFTDETYIKELELQKDELYKVKRQVADKQREYNKLLVMDGRADNLSEYLKMCANKLNKEQPLSFGGNTIESSGKEAILFFSDWHYGMITNNIWNKYNTSICKERVSKLVCKAKEYLALNKIEKLHIVTLGDAAHGCIHNSARVMSEEDTCDEIMHVSEIMAQAVDELSKSVNHILFYSCYGNHLRSIQNKNDSVHSDNMEKLIPWWMTQRMKENRKVEIVDSEFKEFTKLNVLGYNICCVHGDLDNIKNLGSTVNTIFSKIYGETIDYTVSGDKHHLEEFEQFDIENIIIRSLCGTDDYANDKRLYSKAGQTLMIFNKEDGRESTYNIKLN